MLCVMYVLCVVYVVCIVKAYVLKAMPACYIFGAFRACGECGMWCVWYNFTKTYVASMSMHH